MIRVNDISETDSTVFGELKLGDYFIVDDEKIIWKKVCEINRRTYAVQITDDNSYVSFARFNKDQVVTKIKIVSIDYRRIK